MIFLALMAVRFNHSGDNDEWMEFIYRNNYSRKIMPYHAIHLICFGYHLALLISYALGNISMQTYNHKKPYVIYIPSCYYDEKITYLI